ncbi:MAG: adenosine kinase, partial [Acetobacter sp.]|nr:adenosine kinase [Acetobacter sp.]
QDTTLAALTRSALGSVIIHKGQFTPISPIPTQVIDSTGAGDAYAAGFMVGLTSGRTLQECGCIGSVAASEIISHYGARPLTNLWYEMGF